MWFMLAIAVICFTIIVLFRMFIDLKRVNNQHNRLMRVGPSGLRAVHPGVSTGVAEGIHARLLPGASATTTWPGTTPKTR